MDKADFTYPFRPKSTSYLKAGQYWSFKLSDGSNVVGVVLAQLLRQGRVDRRIFLAGLLDWHGPSAPTPKDLLNRRIKERGFAHIKAVTETGGEIVGEVHPCWGYADSLEDDDSISTWGYNVIRLCAEKHFGSKGS